MASVFELLVSIDDDELPKGLYSFTYNVARFSYHMERSWVKFHADGSCDIHNIMFAEPVHLSKSQYILWLPAEMVRPELINADVRRAEDRPNSPFPIGPIGRAMALSNA